ncbi:MAG TPA: shikimate kinase [Bacteriovoracaceae bacterium]|nr:shikimate kinase [Bacteriovoracaceae bacterium]
MALCEKILIAGFSGAGKTSFLKEIEKTAPAGWERFDDLDELVLKNRGEGHKNLAGLIQEVGWEKFRLWERQELEGWLKESGKGVLALGGGALSLMVWELYKNSKKVQFCYLKADFEDCWERLTRVGEEARPMVMKGEDELRLIYNEREAIFSQIPWKITNFQNDNLKAQVRLFWENGILRS